MLTGLSHAKSQVILLKTGEQVQLPSPPHETLFLSRKNIVRIQEKSQSIVLQAQQKGTLTLKQGSSLKIIQVVLPHEKTGWMQFFDIIEKDPWLTIHFLENTLQLQGSMYRFQTWRRIYLLSKKYQIPYTIKAYISPKVQNQAEKFFQSQLKKTFFKIQWGPPVQAEASQKNLLFTYFGIAQKEQPLLAPLVETRLLLTQVSKNWSKAFNIQSSFDWSLFSIDKIAQTYFNQGEGRILASAQMITESGQTSHYLLGGEAPVHTFNAETSSKSVRWKPYGINISITPKTMNRRIVQITLSSEISEIDHAHSSEGSPAVKTLRLKTTLSAENNKTLALSHFHRNHSGSSWQTPLSWIQAVSSLGFGKGFSYEKSKTILFMTPKIIHRRRLP